MYLDNKLITLNSIYGQQNNDSYLSDVMFNFSNILSVDETFIRAFISVENAQLPSSFYIINETNSTLVASTGTYSIPYGNYNAYTLITQLQSSTPFTYAINKLTGKLTISYTSSFILYNSANSILGVLGVIPSFPYSVPVITYELQGSAITFPYTKSAGNAIVIPLITMANWNASGSTWLALPQGTYTNLTQLISTLNAQITARRTFTLGEIPSYPLDLKVVATSVNTMKWVSSQQFFWYFTLSSYDNANSFGIYNPNPAPIVSVSPYQTLPNLWVWDAPYEPTLPCVITSANSSFLTYINGTNPAGYSIPEGTYTTISQLVVAIQSTLDVYPARPMTIEEVNGKLRFKRITSSSDIITFKTVANQYDMFKNIGFGKVSVVSPSITFTYGQLYPYPEINIISESNAVACSYPLNVLGIKQLILHSSSIAISGFDSRILGVNDTLLSIPCNVAPFGLILYENKTDMGKRILVNNSLDQIDIRITDENNNLINFNNIHWCITLCLSVERMNPPENQNLQLVPYLKSLEPAKKEKPIDQEKQEPIDQELKLLES